jgi:uncharacterized repeat protein (TIGR03803 family)
LKPKWFVTASAICLVYAVLPVPVLAQTVRTLVDFNGTNGDLPISVVQGLDGNLYGTTEAGGTNNFCDFGGFVGCGTVFSVSPTGTLTTIYNFCAQNNCADGAAPGGGLLLGTNRDFFGTTSYGGSNGVGTVFKISPSFILTTLHSFQGSDGANPNSSLVQTPNGALYGTAYWGGANSKGSVFEITPAGAFITLHSFSGYPTEGENPAAGLVIGADGNLYGTTTYGGVNASCYQGQSCGTVFKMTSSGSFTTLHSFDNSDGAFPTDPLVEGSDGNLYGTTRDGGAYAGGFIPYGGGTVFRITTAGGLTTLHNFCPQLTSTCPDGFYPSAGLARATDGNLYGVTTGGGGADSGTVFEIGLEGTLTTLCNLSGIDAQFGLIQDTSGIFYGTSVVGGSGGSCNVGCGTVYSFDVGLGPFVETVPTSGKVGKPAMILGTSLTGATSVTFDGVAATFTVVSATVIRATVPVGAKTGPVEVVTPSGTLTSNNNFRVER